MKSINYIILETLLNEGRLEDMVKKYSEKLPEIWIKDLSINDPSGNNKYLEWMVKEVIRLQQEIDDIEASIEKTVNATKCFHDNYNRLNEKNVTEAFKDGGPISTVQRILKSPKDINVYSVESIDILCQYFEKIIPKNASRIKIYEDDRYLVVTPLTHEASCQYGAHSNWCVSTSNTNYFQNYVKDGILIFVIDKKGVNLLKPDANSYKFAIYIYFKDLKNEMEWEFYDMEDAKFSVNLGLNLMGETIKQKIKNYIDEFYKILEKRNTLDLEDIKKNSLFFAEKKLDENSTIEYYIIIDTRNKNQKNYFKDKFKLEYDEIIGYPILILEKGIGLPVKSATVIYKWDYFKNFSDSDNIIDYNTIKVDFFNDLKEFNITFFEILRNFTLQEVEVVFNNMVDVFNDLKIKANKFIRPSELKVGDTVIYRPGLRRWGRGETLKVTRVAEKSIQLSNGKRINRETYNHIEKVSTEGYKVVKKTQTNETRWVRKRIV
jgi:hypothetical protein